MVVLEISKSFVILWHASLLSKLPYIGFLPSLFLLMSRFLSEHFILILIDGITSLSFSVNSGTPLSSLLSRTLFLPFTNNLFNSTSNYVQSKAGDSVLNSPFHFKSVHSFTSAVASRLQLLTPLFSI